jgi:hypothetical protein
MEIAKNIALLAADKGFGINSSMLLPASPTQIMVPTPKKFRIAARPNRLMRPSRHPERTEPIDMDVRPRRDFLLCRNHADWHCYRIDLRQTMVRRRHGNRLLPGYGRLTGIQLVEHFVAEDSTTVFALACRFCLEGIVSKRRDMPYQHGRSRAWLKIGNPEHPASRREWEDR